MTDYHDSYRTDDPGVVHIPNEELDGSGISFYSLGSEDRPNDFGIKLTMPEEVLKQIDFDKMESGEHPPGYYTMGQMMEAMIIVSRQIQLHPNCIEVTNFDGSKHDVSDIGMQQVMEAITSAMGGSNEEAYKKEKEQGIIPDSLSYEDWLEFHNLEPEGSSH